jgi:hypothetical protein
MLCPAFVLLSESARRDRDTGAFHAVFERQEVGAKAGAAQIAHLGLGEILVGVAHSVNNNDLLARALEPLVEIC